MPVEIRVPAMGESVVEATIAQWLKAPGDFIKAGEDLVELETDKVNQVIQAESDGVLSEIRSNAGDTVAVGDVLGVVGEAGAPAATATPATATPATEPAPSSSPATATPTTPFNGTGSGNATPVASRMAAENNVDLNAIKEPTGPAGKIGKQDVTSQISQTQPATAVQKQQEKSAPPAPVAKPSTPQTASPSGRPEERIPMSKRRKVIAQRLVQAQQTAAMLTTFNEADLSAVMEVRKRRKETFEKRFGVGLGFMSFFTKASIGALKAFPYVNAEIQGDEIVLKKYYDIGIAVGAEEGLVVPVVRDADKLGFADIEKQIKALAEKARQNTLTLSELQGGTFTITNGGVYGSLLSTPILNFPQVGILGLHAIKERPVVVNGEIVIRPMMNLALSYDHRIIDGSTAVRFLVKVKELIEDPETLLLEG
jgi:2-oxoglutarate dehydrogenase E2 component (dihydrolipoamide succinyltransferase)